MYFTPPATAQTVLPYVPIPRSLEPKSQAAHSIAEAIKESAEADQQHEEQLFQHPARRERGTYLDIWL